MNFKLKSEMVNYFSQGFETYVTSGNIYHKKRIMYIRDPYLVYVKGDQEISIDLRQLKILENRDKLGGLIIQIYGIGHKQALQNILSIKDEKHHLMLLSYLNQISIQDIPCDISGYILEKSGWFGINHFIRIKDHMMFVYSFWNNKNKVVYETPEYLNKQIDLRGKKLATTKGMISAYMTLFDKKECIFEFRLDSGHYGSDENNFYQQMKKVLAEKVKIKPEKDNGFYYPEEDNNVEINLSNCNKDFCLICQQEPPQYALQPCGHMNYCKNCVDKIKKCVICKQKITKSYKIFK